MENKTVAQKTQVLYYSYMTEKKLTPQQEKFARLVAEGKTQADAYRGAYKVNPKTKKESVIVNASKLMADANITQRVEEIRNKADIKTVETIEKLTKELNRAFEMAMKLEQVSPAVSAVMGKAKLLGLLVDKVETKDLTISTESIIKKARERVEAMKNDNLKPVENND